MRQFVELRVGAIARMITENFCSGNLAIRVRKPMVSRCARFLQSAILADVPAEAVTAPGFVGRGCGENATRSMGSLISLDL